MAQELTMEELLQGLSSPQYMYDRAKAVGPSILRMLSADDSPTIFLEKYHALRASLHRVDTFFSRLGDAEEVVDYAVIMNHFKPYIKALDGIRSECEEGRINRMDAAFNLSIAFGTLKGIEFLQRYVTMKQCP